LQVNEYDRPDAGAESQRQRYHHCRVTRLPKDVLVEATSSRWKNAWQRTPAA